MIANVVCRSDALASSDTSLCQNPGLRLKTKREREITFEGLKKLFTVGFRNFLQISCFTPTILKLLTNGAFIRGLTQVHIIMP